MSEEFLNLDKAAEMLVLIMSDKKSKRSWVLYLKANPTNYPKQHGYKIPAVVIGGELHYREASLRAFAKIMGESAARSELNAKLRVVDKKSLKRSKNKAPKSIKKDWSFKSKRKDKVPKVG